MPPSPFDNLFSKVKQNTQQAGKQMGLAAKIAKLKLEIGTQKSEKDRHLRTIGSKTYAIFCKDKVVDGNVLQTEIANELNLIERIEKHIEELEQEITSLQAQFRTSEGKDFVDASEVKESGDDAASK